MGVLDTIAAATPNTKVIKICLNGALQGQWDALEGSLQNVALGTQSLAAEQTTDILRQMEELREQIAASEVSFEMEQMDWAERINLQAAHPPREGHFVDRLRNYNTETYARAVIIASCVSVTDGTGDKATTIPAELWDRLLGKGARGDEDYIKSALNAGNVDDLTVAAIDVNDKGASVPPSARSLLASQDSGTSSEASGPGTAGSLPADSEAGSQPTSPSTSTPTTSAPPTEPSSLAGD